MSGGVPLSWLAVGDLVDRATAAAQSNPALAAAAVLGALLLAGLAALVVRRLRRSAGDSLLGTLGDVDEVAVLMHPNPDPDAMASAMGVARMADHAGADVTMQYPGEIRHHQNRAFRTVLDLDLEHVESAADITCDDVVLVDHNVPRGFHGAETVEPLAVVDHHPGDGTGRRFTDVRPEYGACASLVAEYLDEVDARLLGPEEDGDNEREDLVVPSSVVTGLAFGILSDTSHLTDGCSPAEFEASSQLYPAIDTDLLNRIENPRVDAETLDVKARAIAERDVRTPYAVSDVGEVDNVDAIPQAADELVDLETVTAVVVLGDDGETIHLSGRSRDDRVHMGEVLEDVTDDIPMAGGGGHARMGGGQIDVAHMTGLGPGEGTDRSELTAKLFAAMSGRELTDEEPLTAGEE